MTPTSKKYNPKYAISLIKIAEGDLLSARALAKAKAKEGRPENICFILQQSVEKSINAVLCHHGRAIPFTHDLVALCSILPDSISLPGKAAAVEGLSEYATVRRYEEGFVEITQQEVVGALKTAEYFLSWAKKIIGQ